jgi:hypothetical protein
MTADIKNTFDLLVTISTFGTAVAGGAFWVASWKAQMQLRDLQLQIKNDQLQFRVELLKDINQNHEDFKVDVQKSLDNYRQRIGLLRASDQEIVSFLNKQFNFRARREPPQDSFPTDFTVHDNR